MFHASKKFVSKKIETFLRSLHMQAYSLIFIEILAGAIISIFSFLFFVKIAKDVLEQDQIFIDTVLSQIIYSFRNPELTELMKFFSFLGGEFIVFASIIIVIVLFLFGQKRETIVFIFAIIFGNVLNTIIKFLLKVPRPTIDPLLSETFYSFPSGHAMNAFIFYAMVSFLLFHYTRRKILSGTVAIVSISFIFLIGFSRVYLGVHYPTDVIAGFIAGFWWFVTVIVLDKTLHFYSIFKGKKKKN